MAKRGTYIFIIEDVREGNPATGEIGIYEGKERIEGCVFPTPRIRLIDNSVIYGYQCWWREVESPSDLPDLEMEQAALEEHKKMLREIFIALEDTNG